MSDNLNNILPDLESGLFTTIEKNKSVIELNNTIIFHPGYYIKEYLNKTNVTYKTFSEKLELTIPELCLLIDGYLNVDVKLADKLSKEIGTSKEYWLNLQEKYDTVVNKFFK